MQVRRLLALIVTPLLFADYLGISPRPASSEYAAHVESATVSIGAEAAASGKIRGIFGRDWSSRYLFVEVALYPAAGTQLTLTPRDFMLRVGTNSESLAPLDPEAILPGPKPMSKTPTAGSASPVDVQVRETIGYSSGPYNRGVYTDSQVGVSAGSRGAAPLPTAADDPNFELRRALLDNELPDAKTSKPIAGYLYFPKPKGTRKSDSYELKYYGPVDRLTVKVPPARRH